MDKRTVETKKKIEDELINQLVEGKVLSIKDISEKCGINRNTFYIHYNNIDQAVDSVLQQFTDEIITKIDDYTIEELLKEPQLVSKQIINVLCQNEKILSLTLKSKIASPYVIGLTSELVNHINLRYINEIGKKKNVYLNINFLVAGFVHSLFTLVNKYPDLEEIDELLCHLEPLVKYGLLAVENDSDN